MRDDTSSSSDDDEDEASARQDAEALHRARLERKQKLERMMDDDGSLLHPLCAQTPKLNLADEPMQDAAPTPSDPEPESNPIDAPQPEREPSEPPPPVTTSEGRRRGRRKVMKKKTIKDEEGYLSR
jgi:DNA polymerase delta subunit 3